MGNVTGGSDPPLAVTGERWEVGWEGSAGVAGDRADRGVGAGSHRHLRLAPARVGRVAHVDAGLRAVEEIRDHAALLELENREAEAPRGTPEVGDVVHDPGQPRGRGRPGVAGSDADPDVIPGPVHPGHVDVELAAGGRCAEHRAGRVHVEIPGAGVTRRDPRAQVAGGRRRRRHAHAALAVATGGADVTAGATVGVRGQARLAAVAHVAVAVAVARETRERAGVADAAGVAVRRRRARAGVADRRGRRRGDAAAGCAGLARGAGAAAVAAVGHVGLQVDARTAAGGVRCVAAGRRRGSRVGRGRRRGDARPGDAGRRAGADVAARAAVVPVGRELAARGAASRTAGLALGTSVDRRRGRAARVGGRGHAGVRGGRGAVVDDRGRVGRGVSLGDELHIAAGGRERERERERDGERRGLHENLHFLEQPV